MCIISLTGIGGKFFFSAIVVISEINDNDNDHYINTIFCSRL